MLFNHVGTPCNNNKNKNNNNNNSKPTEKCVICQDPLTNDIVNISGCSHKFHKDCIENWKNITNKCPVCRKRFNYIEQGRLKFKVENRDQKHDDALTDQYLNELADEPCQICQSSDYAEMCLLCDGCDKCYHTHCLGLDEIPDGDWFCDTCKYLQPGYISPNSRSRGFLRRLGERVRARRNRRNGNRYYNGNNRNNRYDDIMISRNENNPEWLQTQDEDWEPDYNDMDQDEDDIDIDEDGDEEEDVSSENNEELEELKEDKPNDLEKFSFNGKNRNKRKRKRNQIESDNDDDDDGDDDNNNNYNNKRRKKNGDRSRNGDNGGNNDEDIKRLKNGWNCNVCTYLNDDDVKKDRCLMCKTKKRMNGKKERKNKEIGLSINDYFDDDKNKMNKNKNDDIHVINSSDEDECDFLKTVNRNNGNKRKKDKKTKKLKFSRSNPYKKKSVYSPFPNDRMRTKADIKRIENGKMNINDIVGNDILSRFDLQKNSNQDINDSDDWLSMIDVEDIKPLNTLNSNNNNNNNYNGGNLKINNKMIEEIQDSNDDHLEFNFKPKPKMKYGDRYKKLTLKSQKNI